MHSAVTKIQYERQDYRHTLVKKHDANSTRAHCIDSHRHCFKTGYGSVGPKTNGYLAAIQLINRLRHFTGF
ncbi:hypothetical protein DF164_31165 [Burkholderia stagnalis]|nr:hypothetical protein DF164_31165 [Burkholderia stagnalis]